LVVKTVPVALVKEMATVPLPGSPGCFRFVDLVEIEPFRLIMLGKG
jgi:hypothetical protein